jgi:2-polyprenyl-3-methyl-5-hydroxy-6-metoxy-1,4-benzoquinol methylase
MNLIREIASPLTGAWSRPRSIVRAGDYKIAWFEDSQMWSVIDMPALENVSSAYQDFNAGEHSRSNFSYYLNQSNLILQAELVRAGWDKSSINGLSMLDYGCGGGHFVGAASQLGMRAVGMELDSIAAEAAKSNDIHVINGILPKDIDKLSGRKFDVIKVSHVLEHIPNLADLVACLVSLLERNGALIINVPDQNSFPSRLKIFLRHLGIKKSEFGYVQPPIHLHGFTKRSFDALAEAFHMRLVSCYEYSPLDGDNFPTAPDYWRGLGPQKVVYMIGRYVRSGGYLTAILRKT